jgi:Mce-associated membrane protein
MAANAETPDGELNKTATRRSSAPPDPTEKDSTASPADSDLTSAARADEVDAAAEEAEDYDADEAEAEDYDAAIEDEAIEDEASEADVDEDDVEEDDAAEPAKRRMSHLRLAAIAGAAIIVALAATVGWLGFRSYQSHQAEAQRQQFLQIGRQCALNLTTIDFQHADGDVQRVLDSATGQFYDQFSKRKQPFIDVLKKAQSKSVGTITEAGVESESGDKAQVLVAVSIKTTNLGVEDQAPRQWRMRITVEKSGSDTKISNVAFVP